MQRSYACKLALLRKESQTHCNSRFSRVFNYSGGEDGYLFITCLICSLPQLSPSTEIWKFSPFLHYFYFYFFWVQSSHIRHEFYAENHFSNFLSIRKTAYTNMSRGVDKGVRMFQGVVKILHRIDSAWISFNLPLLQKVPTRPYLHGWSDAVIFLIRPLHVTMVSLMAVSVTTALQIIISYTLTKTIEAHW